MIFDKNSRRQRLLLAAAACLMMALGIVTNAHAQGSTAVIGEGGPRDQHRGARQRPGSTATPNEGEMTPKLKQEPVQRLEAGALLCKTEADLQQHEAAVQARLNGGEAAEPRGCRLVQAMISVSVVQRHGLNRTEVKAGDQLGWTDTLIRNP
jgi:hypothetical protein